MEKTSNKTLKVDNLSVCGSLDNIFQISLWNLQNESQRWRRFSYVTKKHRHHHHHHHHHKQNAETILLQNKRCKIV